MNIHTVDKDKVALAMKTAATVQGGPTAARARCMVLISSADGPSSLLLSVGISHLGQITLNCTRRRHMMCSYHVCMID